MTHPLACVTCNGSPVEPGCAACGGIGFRPHFFRPHPTLEVACDICGMERADGAHDVPAAAHPPETSGFYWVRMKGRWWPALLSRVVMPDGSATDARLLYVASGDDELMAFPSVEEVEEWGPVLTLPPGACEPTAPFVSDHFGGDAWEEDTGTPETPELFGARRFAALTLLFLMRDLSEGCWCAGWMQHLEHDLWRIALAGKPCRYGIGPISADDVAALRLLSRAAGGWWRWTEPQGETWTPMAEWLAVVDSTPVAEPR